MALQNPSIPNGVYNAVVAKIAENNVVHFSVEGYGLSTAKIMNLQHESLSWIQPGLSCRVVVLDGVVSTVENPEG